MLALHQSGRSRYKPTVACALYAPESGSVALVRSWDAFEQETADEALRPVQTEVRQNETATEAYLRKVADELHIGTDGLRSVHGLLTNRNPMLTGRQGNRRAFGALCGVVEGLPDLPTGDRPAFKNISAGWYSISGAEQIFQVQLGRMPHRGERNLHIMHGIRRLGHSLGYTAGL
jgi:hypothetical protein